MSVWEGQFYRILPGDDVPSVWHAIRRPLGFERGPKDASDNRQPPADFEKLDILVVEDDVLVALHIEGLLHNWGYARTAITNSREATIDIVRKQRPALVLVDIRLGERDVGVDLAREIIQTFAIPVVFVTGLTGPKVDEAIRSVGPVAVVVKPFTGDLLRRVVEEAMSRSAG